MKRNEYTILKRHVPDVHLHSVTGSYWFDNQDDLYSWYQWEEFVTYNINDVVVYNELKYKSLSNNNKGNKVNNKTFWVEVNLSTLPTNKRGFLPSGYTPYSGYVVNNVTGSLPTGSYIWNGTSWTGLTGSLNQSYKIPIVLDADVDEMGVMTSFDGNMEQVEQLVNFTYKVSGSVVTIYGTTNPDKFRKIVDQEFTVEWGVRQNLTGSIITGSLEINKGTLYTNLPTTGFDYTPYTASNTGSYVETYTGSSISSFNVSVYLNSPWSKQKMTKTITLFDTGSITDNVNILGTFSGFTIPYTIISGSFVTGSLNYLNDYEYSNTGYTATPTKPFKFMAIGISKIGELRKYGESTVSTSSYTTGSFSGSLYTGYTLPNDSGSLYYMDLADGYTMITGSVPNYRFGPTSGYTYVISGNTINTGSYLTTSGNTTEFATEYVINHMLTRNEHFLGFIDDPTVYSDIFVERGRQGIMEPNLRLGEIDNMKELDVYGNGYFKVRK
jgi:hypothetical protein